MPQAKSLRGATSSRRGSGRGSRSKQQGITEYIRFAGPVPYISDSDFASGKYTPSTSTRTGYALFKGHAYVYACIRAISTNIAQVPIKITAGSKDNPQEFDGENESAGDDLVKLFNLPNPYQTSFDMWERTVQILNLTGNCFWVMERASVTDIPEMITVWGPDRVEPVYDQEKLLGWAFRTNEESRIPLTLWEVLHFKFVSPDDPVMGIGPIEAARRGIILDLAANQYSRAFFENSASPEGVILSKKRMSVKQAKELQELWEDRHRGPGNAKKVAVLWGETDYKTVSISQKDMEFIEQRKWTRDEILAVFKVPKSELSLYEDVNYATSVSQDRGFWQKTLLPIIKKFQATIASHFIPGIRAKVGKGLKIFFDTGTVEALQEDLTGKITNAEKLSRIGYPINMINDRLKMGFPKVEWGDMWFLNQAITTVERVISGENMTPGDNNKPSGRSVPGEDGNPEDADDEEKPDEEDDEGEERALVLKREVAMSAPSLQDVYKAFFWKLRKHQLARIVRKEDAFDLHEWSLKLFEKSQGALLPMNLVLFPGNGYIDFSGSLFLQELHKGLTQILAGSSDIEARLEDVRIVFNRLSEQTVLEKAVKIDLMARYRKMRHDKVAAKYG